MLVSYLKKIKNTNVFIFPFSEFNYVKGQWNLMSLSSVTDLRVLKYTLEKGNKVKNICVYEKLENVFIMFFLAHWKNRRIKMIMFCAIWNDIIVSKWWYRHGSGEGGGTLNKLFCRGFIIAELNIFWKDIYWGNYQDRKNTRSVNNLSSFLVLSEREIDSGLIFTTSVFSLHVL